MKFETAHVKYEDSAMGKLQGSLATQHADRIDELQKLRDEFSQYRAEEAAYHAAEALREKCAEKRGFWKGVLSAVVSGIIVSIFSYYWPTIVSLVTKIFQ